MQPREWDSAPACPDALPQVLVFPSASRLGLLVGPGLVPPVPVVSHSALLLCLANQ